MVKFRIGDKVFNMNFDGILAAHQYWLVQMGQFDALRGQIRRKYKQDTMELVLFAEQVARYQPLNQAQTTKILEIIRRWVNKYNEIRV